MKLTRDSTSELYTVDAEADAKILFSSTWAGGTVQVAGALTINVYGCNYENPQGRTFVQAYDMEGFAKRIVAAGAGVFDLPPIHGNKWIKLVGTETEVALNRAG
jgi:hypothetical protein